MNVSAPTPVPDLAGLALLLALAPDSAMKSSGFAPSPSPGAGAGTSRSFQAALHDLLPGKDAAQDKPAAPGQQSEEKTTLTVPVPVPVPPEALPWRLAMPAPAAPVLAPPNASPLGQPQVFQTVGGAPASPATVRQPPAGGLSAAADGRVDLLALRATPAVATDGQTLSIPDIAFTARLTPVPAMAPTGTAGSATSASCIGPVGSADALTAHKISVARQSAEATHVVSEPAGEASLRDAASQMGAARSVASDHGADRRNQEESQGHPEKTEAGADSPSRLGPPLENAGLGFEGSVAATGAATESHGVAAARSAPPQPPEDAQPSDPAPVAPPPNPHPAETHNISLRVADTGDHPLELKLTDRGGEVRVSVRTQDPELAGPLRENLGELVHKLEQSGFRAETWYPAQPGSMDSHSQQGRPNSESFPGGRQQQEQQPQPQGRGRDQQESRQARWAQEMESSFAPDSERREFPWPAASIR